MSMNKPAGGAQFTPGPWEVNTFIVNGQHKLEVLDATGANACVQANATLIAAAPAMYEALQIMVRAANVDEIDPLVMFASIERARHVLKLAEGKSA
jgi:hypothetical protein